MNTMQSGDDASELMWVKSSYSSSEGGMCVEVAAGPVAIHVRDSKHAQGPQLAFHIAEWGAFIGSLRAGEFGA
ncbi:DUF397 domain-containing protein [Streptomyces coffeae]|uniref:DUF397 domain-containing protein n=1 Tax=Streptomyces coffeae TaxID=621382 RepID=A0ABS1NR70_9ACTN|nr:DUF397 domain-containing protein [Streptomyces coffeae]MBL1102572.1 DUF397 domain-containing protein [Streptomyces coffeae]